jgi:hypothetical protein
MKEDMVVAVYKTTAKVSLKERLCPKKTLIPFSVYQKQTD